MFLVCASLRTDLPQSTWITTRRRLSLRSILATTRQSTQASLDCLATRLTSFRSLTPEHRIDRKFEFARPNETPSKHDIPTCESKSQVKKVELQDVGAPAWAEEQRATRAFWRLQLI